MSSKHQLMSQVSLPSMVCQDHKDAQIRLLLLSGCVFVIFRGGGGGGKGSVLKKLSSERLFFPIFTLSLFFCCLFVLLLRESRVSRIVIFCATVMTMRKLPIVFLFLIDIVIEILSSIQFCF